MRSFVASALLCASLLLARRADAQPPAPGASDAYCRSVGATTTGNLKCCVNVVDFRRTGATELSSDVCNYCKSVGICPQGNTDYTKVNANSDICAPGGKWEMVRQSCSIRGSVVEADATVGSSPTPSPSCALSR